MSRIRILSVGQCSFDDGNIRRSLGKPLDADIVAADTHEEATKVLRAGTFDLVLVNRIGDSDGASGLELIRSIKGEPATSNITTMLVSNYISAQNEAKELGAAVGFGKDALATDEAVNVIKKALAGSTS